MIILDQIVSFVGQYPFVLWKVLEALFHRHRHVLVWGDLLAAYLGTTLDGEELVKVKYVRAFSEAVKRAEERMTGDCVWFVGMALTLGLTNIALQLPDAGRMRRVALIMLLQNVFHNTFYGCFVTWRDQNVTVTSPETWSMPNTDHLEKWQWIGFLLCAAWHATFFRIPLVSLPSTGPSHRQRIHDREREMDILVHNRLAPIIAEQIGSAVAPALEQVHEALREVRSLTASLRRHKVLN